MIFRNKEIFRVIVCIFVTSLLLSCVKEEYDGPDPNLPSRTVLVYLGGDNNLSSTLKSEVEALRKGWTYTGNRCVIYIDSSDDVPMLLSLRGGCKNSPTPYIDTLAVYTEENSASSPVLRRVIDDVVRLHPADSYGLIFASHATGWLPEGALINSARSIGADSNVGTMGTSSSEMELADFAEAIPDGQFDFIVFEACFMAGVEVIYELRNKTNYILSSSAELLVPGFIPIYPRALRYLFDTRYRVEEALQQFAQTYYNHVDMQSGAYRSTTLSIIKTEGMEVLASRVKELLLDANRVIEASDIASLQHFDRPGSYGYFSSLPRYFDFEEYIKKIATLPHYAPISSLIEDVVQWKAATTLFMIGYNGFSIDQHSGMTVYIEQDNLEELNAAYRQTKWYKATH